MRIPVMMKLAPTGFAVTLEPALKVTLTFGATMISGVFFRSALAGPSVAGAEVSGAPGYSRTQ